MAEQSTTTYWPEGWDRERLLNSGVTGELEDLATEQVLVIRAGLIADFGEDAFDDLMAELRRRKEADANMNTASSSPPELFSWRRWDTESSARAAGGIAGDSSYTKAPRSVTTPVGQSVSSGSPASWKSRSRHIAAFQGSRSAWAE
ncbi:hypothetical protein F5Y17DRAFT_386513 [Xylariaceae sp. FL0594]|nr:hypothetical protein F5Y17DRAFT_386513 [Xylariaceae sp. FL0594]